MSKTAIAAISGIAGFSAMLIFLFIQSKENFSPIIFYATLYYLIPGILATILISKLIQSKEGLLDFFGGKPALIISFGLTISLYFMPLTDRLREDYIFHFITLIFLWFSVSLATIWIAINKNAA